MSRIQTYTDLPFYIIVNPTSGLESTATPDINYQGCIPLLHHSNVKILGYIPTTHGSRASSAILGKCLQTRSAVLDEISTDSTNLTVYQNTTSGTRAIWGSAPHLIKLTDNVQPDVTPVAGYFSLANFIVTFENTYSIWQATNLTIDSGRPANKQVVLIHAAPAVLQTVVDHQLVSLGVSSSFVTNFPDCAGTYNGYSSFFPNLVADIRSVQ
ncbi:hypothetical protein M422DRAFT_48005 [Sphaerobolus stellatus SS14]|uniref:Uncharacterized protein n=1 Tax=Sphaerobolus stellatus (strain SS14) TaxID=990650 RepID=A0A0C9V833_SPHS4|nr:hypothetical protein M422DRAFT_48005 [Sphaerobolus stellatus SS14]